MTALGGAVPTHTACGLSVEGEPSRGGAMADGEALLTF